MLLQGIDYSNIKNNHKVLEALTLKGVSMRYRHEWNKGMPYMVCNKFNIYYESFDTINADKNLLRKFSGRDNRFYNSDELEGIVENTFHILKMWNDDYLNLFNTYLRYIDNYTVFVIDMDYANKLTSILDREDLTFKQVLDKCVKKRNWAAIPHVNIVNFKRELDFDRKLFKNRELLKRAIKLYSDGEVVTMSRIGIAKEGYCWRNIESMVNELNKFTDLPKREDALHTISEAFRYFEFVGYKPSVNEVKGQIGGSVGVIKIAMKYFYERDKLIYSFDSKDVICKMQDKVDNPLDYNYELIERGGGVRLILTEKTQ